MTKKLSAALIFVCMVEVVSLLGVLGADAPAEQPRDGQTASAALANKDVVDMLKAGLTPSIVIAKIRTSRCTFDTSPAALQALKAAGVPDEVILVMVETPSSSAKATAPPRVTDELTTQFKRLQNSVVTVWSEFGHGTGFIVDPAGLVLTNQHVIGPSEYIAVQFDERRKLAAVLLAADAGKDVAVLRTNLSVVAEAVVAPIAQSSSSEPLVVEGERVFTIGSPLHQTKILTTGIVSKLEAHVILSDININHGNSGGPLFNSVGSVVGITTFHDPDLGGAGVSGIVRIEEVGPVLDQAKVKMAQVPLPKATLLPVEPSDTFPIEAIKATLMQSKFDRRPYLMEVGDYDVAVITPPLHYYLAEAGTMEAARAKEKRTRKQSQAVKGTFQPLEDLKNWAEYLGEYKPIILVQATPKLRETFGSALARGLASSGGRYAGPANMRFKTDFYRMRLLCGEREIQPILPAKVAHVVNTRNAFVRATDATYEGIYSFPPDAISPQCGHVTLELYSEKNPDKAKVQVLSDKTVERVWSDFEPYRKSSGESAAQP
jgi:S1-C subfamily serine protease